MNGVQIKEKKKRENVQIYLTRVFVVGEIANLTASRPKTFYASRTKRYHFQLDFLKQTLTNSSNKNSFRFVVMKLNFAIFREY